MKAASGGWFSAFVEANLRGMADPPGSKLGKRRVTRLLCLHFMLALSRNKKRAFTTGHAHAAKDLNIPVPVVRYLFNLFAAEERGFSMAKYSRTQTLKAKLHMHIVVLALLLGRGILDLNLLRQDLQVPPVKMTALARETGCTVETRGGKNGTHRAVLKLPLNFPVQQKAKGQKARR
uniref:Uncharacterized protein n=1 Tax=Fibrocapsa japonica TaxID=94617 RepID=A0A7S2V2D5_9STRA|mmetsp:Transcript_22592/g.32787  ORF Transcript_22592/g.32787 Transcript_22592/m.32787 type:complete len:177 (+) Transcript_22592:2-532(+)